MMRHLYALLEIFPLMNKVESVFTLAGIPAKAHKTIMGKLLLQCIKDWIRLRRINGGRSTGTSELYQMLTPIKAPCVA